MARIYIHRRGANRLEPRRDEADTARVRWWALRIIGVFDLGESVDDHTDKWRNLARLVDLNLKPFDSESGLSRVAPQRLKAQRKVLSALRARCKKALATPPPSVEGAVFFANACAVAESLGLTVIERELLEFAAMFQRDACLTEIESLLEDITREDCIALLAAATGQPAAEVERAMRPLGRLAQSGILRFETNISGRANVRLFLDVLVGVSASLHSASFAIEELLAHFAQPVAPATLTLDEYPHLAEFTDLARRLLHTAFEARTPGVNILIYGVPGTGKTEYTKALAHAIDAALCEVPTTDGSGEEHPGSQRARAYQFAQAALSGRPRQLLLFDEIEDLFPELSFGVFGAKEKVVSKGWVNRSLETNRVPTLWISNEIEQMDPAYRRRFNLAIEFKVPPRKVRQRIAARHMGDLGLSEAFLGRVADAEQVSPALVQQAAQVARLAQGANRTQDVCRALKGSLDALGLPPLSEAEALVTEYRLDYLNPTADLTAIVDGLKRTGEGRLCLFGAPGTGKTAFARHLALVLDRPLIAKRASDLMSMWVGQTEKNIARMFRDASENEAVLLLDEADSLLRDRNQAQAGWESTQVNEMLTNMEVFRGVFVCSTNRQSDLDPASLRRFDRKIEFKALRPEQRWALLAALLTRHGVALPTGSALADSQAALARLDSLTPGDFAAVARGRRLEGGIIEVEAVLRDLAAECAVKRGESRGIGFLAVDQPRR